MLNENTMYRFNLENYATPQSNPNPFSYFAAMDDVLQWATAISKDKDLSKRYQHLITALDEYDLDPEITHMVAGQEVCILEPIKVLARAEVTMTALHWTYTTYKDAIYPMSAHRADICQVLLDDSSKLHRCIKVRFEHPCVCLQNGGWILLNDSYWGTPEMLVFCENTSTMRMYVRAQTYTTDQYQQAIDDLSHPTDKDLAIASHDLIGLGAY